MNIKTLTYFWYNIKSDRCFFNTVEKVLLSFCLLACICGIEKLIQFLVQGINVNLFFLTEITFVSSGHSFYLGLSTAAKFLLLPHRLG